MGIPESAEKLMEQLNRVDELLESAEETAEDPEIKTEAVTEPLASARESVQIASEQLGNFIAGR